MDSNSTRKYTLYALGEILLVVLGILIALQINNWNENRLNAIEEKRIVVTIADEMNSLRWQIERGFENYNGVLASSDRLVSCINESNLNCHHDSIDLDLSGITERWLLGLSNETNIYDALTGSGEFGLLASHKLRQHLKNLKSNLMLLATYEGFQTRFVDEQLFPYLNEHIDGVSISDIRSRIRTDRYNYTPYVDSITINESGFETDYASLLSSQYFSNLLLQNMKHTATLLPIYRRLANNVAQIDTIVMTTDPALIFDPF